MATEIRGSDGIRVELSGGATPPARPPGVPRFGSEHVRAVSVDREPLDTGGLHHSATASHDPDTFTGTSDVRDQLLDPSWWPRHCIACPARSVMSVGWRRRRGVHGQMTVRNPCPRSTSCTAWSAWSRPHVEVMRVPSRSSPFCQCSTSAGTALLGATEP